MDVPHKRSELVAIVDKGLEKTAIKQPKHYSTGQFFIT